MSKTKFLLIYLILSILNCTNNVSDSGGASETVAAIEINNKNINGSITPAGTFTIKVFDKSFIPLFDTSDIKFRDTLLSDDDGSFKINFPYGGLFNLFIFDEFNNSLNFSSIRITDSTYKIEDTLRESGEINGSLISDEKDLIENAYISLVGSDITITSDSEGDFYLDSIPQGIYSIYYATFDTLDSINDSNNWELNNSETINNIPVVSGTIESINLKINSMRRVKNAHFK